MRESELTVPIVSKSIAASTLREGWSWQYGLVNICADNEAHKRLLELVAEYPCHLSEPSRRPLAESAAACETDSERGIFDAKDYKESLRLLLSCTDYAGAAVLKKTIIDDAQAKGYDIAAAEEATKAMYLEIKEEELASKKRSYDEQWPANERCLRARGAG